MPRLIRPCLWCGATAFAPVRTINLDLWGLPIGELDGLVCGSCGHLEMFVKAQTDAGTHVLAHVFKIVVYPYIGKMAVFRIHQGTVRRDGQLYIGSARQPFRVAHLMRLQGKDHIDIVKAGPGDICATAKVDEIAYDAVLHDAPEDGNIHLAPLAFPNPIYALAIEPERRGNEQRLWEILQKLAAEDPCLRIEHPVGTNETVVRGLGELHLRHML